MNTKDYDALSKDLGDYAMGIQVAKRPGYTRGDNDVLKNFKDVAARTGLTPGQSWSVYFLKHIDAITSIMTKPHLPISEAPEGRFADAINYLYLGWALLQEEAALQVAPASEFRGAAMPFHSDRDLGDER